MDYTFKCKECKKEYTIVSTPKVFGTFSISCPFCSSYNYQRVFNPVNIIYKTGNFYTTENREREQSK